MASTPPQVGSRVLRCYHCGHHFASSVRTVSTSCPKCSKPLSVEDVVIKTAHSVRKLQTCGRLQVAAKGLLIAPVIEAQEGVEVLGTLEGNVHSGGPVSIGPKAHWKGDCRAPSLRVELGAQIARGYFVIPDATHVVKPEVVKPEAGV